MTWGVWGGHSLGGTPLCPLRSRNKPAVRRNCGALLGAAQINTSTGRGDTHTHEWIETPAEVVGARPLTNGGSSTPPPPQSGGSLSNLQIPANAMSCWIQRESISSLGKRLCHQQREDKGGISIDLGAGKKGENWGDPPVYPQILPLPHPTLTGVASMRILPQDTASSGRAPESEPSNSCAVFT